MTGLGRVVLKAAVGAPLYSARGLGLGLVSWGPVILGAVAALAVYGYWKKNQDDFDQSETDAEIKDALD